VTPPVLQTIAEQIRDEARIRVEGDWEIDEKGRWHLAIVTHLSVAPSQHMPGETKWRVVIGPNQPADGVFIYPDAVGGIATTFRHQDYNPEPEPGAMWRDGKPCLERPIDGLGRDQWEDEPRELAAAALWKTGRLLQWIDAAAADALVEEGAANELPAGVGIGSKLTLGFREVFEGLDWAASVGERWGFASIASVPGATKTWALTELLDDRSNSIRRFEWGTSLAAAPSSIGAVWLLVPVLPVREPWDAPKTWAQLRDVLMAHNVDLVDIMVRAGARYRAGSRKTATHQLLIGFPYSQRVGEAPSRLHWLAIGKMPLAGRTEKRDGFRPREESRKLWDRQLAGSSKSLNWLRTENWAPDQLQSRGGVEPEVSSKKILIVGAGSLGSAIAENLVRAGAHRVGVMDGEILVTGNLVRHVLSMNDVGHAKADALVRKLNSVSPNAALQSFPMRFDRGMASDFAENVRGYDVIVDCTGSDDTLEHLSDFDWQDEKTFISLSMTWGAEGLLAFCAKEGSFPVIDAKNRFAKAGAPAVRHDEANVEAIGCWHPVFPASSDDVQQWAALGSKFCRAAIIDSTRCLRYFRRNASDGVEVIDV